MKFTKKNNPVFIQLLLLSGFIGTVAWALFELVLHQFGISFSLQLQNIGFDLYIVSFFININPGTVLGAILGGVLFFRI